MRAAVTGDGTDQRVQSLMFMIMLMVIPFSTMTSSRYPVLSAVLKLNYYNAVAEDIPFI